MQHPDKTEEQKGGGGGEKRRKMMAFLLTPGYQIMSDLLTAREKVALYTLLQPQCKLLKSTVAQLLVAAENQHKELSWSCLGCGAVCLVEDRSVNSYFLRLYCVKSSKLLWEQELYIPFVYTPLEAFFHTFLADGHQAGFNFASVAEAEEFHLAVKAVCAEQEKNEVTNTNKDGGSTCDPAASSEKPAEQHSPTDAPSASDLGHLAAMTNLLRKVQLTEEDLRDKDVAEAVDCIIERCGGLQAVKRELGAAATNSVPATAPKRCPLLPVPHPKSGVTSTVAPQDADTQRQSATPVSSAPSTPAPVAPDAVTKTPSSRQVSSATAKQ